MKLRNQLLFVSGLAALGAMATTDYTSLEGLSGAALKRAVKEIALPHTEIAYGDATWKAFESADVRIIDDREAWWDMYSNRLVWVSTGHSGMNIEHAVANSWWGGEKNEAYKDLHHLNPSDADANNRKSNNPLAPLARATWSNGLSSVGTPMSGYGGGASVAFEPADEYKGDFARAYFYIFTLYDDISWQASPACMYELTAWPTLQPWAYSMLLDWAASDPVDEREAARNAAVAAVQKNENPFVSIPGLAEHIWGEAANVPLSLAEAMTPPVENRPDAPRFGDYTLAGVNTWAGRWWDTFDIELEAPEDTYIFWADGEDEPFQPYLGYITVPAATQAGESRTIRAYCQTWLNGFPYRSSVSTLTLTAFEEGTTDYMHAEWQRVTSESDINEDGIYIAVASKALAVMGCETGSSSSSNYIKTPGNVDVNDEGMINLLPEGAAVLKLEPAGGTEWYVRVNDLALEPKGYLWTDTAKKCYIREEGMGVEVSVDENENVRFNFGPGCGTLQYNAQSPRFSVYTSNQQPLDLYRCMSGNSGVSAAPAVISPECEAPVWYTLDGFRLSGEPTAPGIYIRVAAGRAVKVLR
ncbi:MAG: endonuclease [Muribaculaceae bacterium]|nr:endonuclease [Muribaculaceae bacterium]